MSDHNTEKQVHSYEEGWVDKGKSNIVQTGQGLYTSIVCAFRKVSKLRVWGLGRLKGFCNPAFVDNLDPIKMGRYGIDWQ